MNGLILFLILIFIFLLVFLIVILYFRRVFVLKTNFGSFTAPLWTACSAQNCGEVGTQQLISSCVPNPRTGAGCVDFNDPELVQSYNSKIYQERQCTAICPQTTEKIINVSNCVNSTKTVTYQCVSTGISGGPKPCTLGQIRTQSVPCEEIISGYWNTIPPQTNLNLNGTCGTGTNNDINSFLLEGYTTTPLTCVGGNCPIDEFNPCYNPEVYSAGYNYVTDCLINNVPVTSNMCRLYPVVNIPVGLEPYIYRPFYFRTSAGYLSATSANNLFYASDRTKAILLYLIPRKNNGTTYEMIFLVGAFGDAWFLNFSTLTLSPVRMNITDASSLTTGQSSRFNVSLSGNNMTIQTPYISGTVELQAKEIGFDWINRT